MKNKVRNNFLLNTIGSVLYSSTSFFFMIIVTRKLGLSNSGIFTFAFSTSCLFQVIGVYYGRVFQVTETDDKITDSDYTYSKIVTCMLMLLVGFIFLLVKRYSSFKCLIILLLVIYKMIGAFAESLYAIIQRNDDLYKVGISLILKAFIEIIVFYLTCLLSNNLIVACLSLIISELLILIIYDFCVVKNYNFKLSEIRKKHIITILKLGFPVFVFTILTQYLINAPKYAIDNFLDDNTQSVYGMLSMIATITVMFGQLILHPYLTSLSKDLKEKKYDVFNSRIIKIIGFLFIAGALECLLGYFWGTSLLGIVYNVNLSEYSFLLLIIIVGSIFYSIVSILSNALISMRINNIQSVLFFLDSIIIYFISNELVKNYGINGAGYSYFCCMFILLVMFLILYFVQYKKISGGEKHEN